MISQNVTRMVVCYKNYKTKQTRILYKNKRTIFFSKSNTCFMWVSIPWIRVTPRLTSELELYPNRPRYCILKNMDLPGQVSLTFIALIAHNSYPSQCSLHSVYFWIWQKMCQYNITQNRAVKCPVIGLNINQFSTQMPKISTQINKVFNGL